MELKELIERAEKAAGSQKALGLLIDQAPSHLRNAKAGMQGLPAYACIQIAKLINMPEITVIAASALVTEKKAERRAIFLPFVGRAAGVLIGAVILNMSAEDANAALAINLTGDQCILYKIAKRKGRALKQRLLKTLQLCIPKSYSSFLILRVHHMPT